MRNLKKFSGKLRQRVPNNLSQNLVIGIVLKNCFGAILSSKTNVRSVSKEHFSFFYKFLSDEVETIFWERESKRSKLVIS